MTTAHFFSNIGYHYLDKILKINLRSHYTDRYSHIKKKIT